MQYTQWSAQVAFTPYIFTAKIIKRICYLIFTWPEIAASLKWTSKWQLCNVFCVNRQLSEDFSST